MGPGHHNHGHHHHGHHHHHGYRPGFEIGVGIGGWGGRHCYGYGGYGGYGGGYGYGYNTAYYAPQPRTEVVIVNPAATYAPPLPIQAAQTMQTTQVQYYNNGSYANPPYPTY